MNTTVKTHKQIELFGSLYPANRTIFLIDSIYDRYRDLFVSHLMYIGSKTFIGIWASFSLPYFYSGFDKMLEEEGFPTEFIIIESNFSLSSKKIKEFEKEIINKYSDIGIGNIIRVSVNKINEIVDPTTYDVIFYVADIDSVSKDTENDIKKMLESLYR